MSSESYEVLEPLSESCSEEVITISPTFDEEDSVEAEEVFSDESIRTEEKTRKRVKRNLEVARDKRALVFRPLFVYRRQEVRRERVKEPQTTKATKKSTTRPKSSG